jgi:hypothetical protein
MTTRVTTKLKGSHSWLIILCTPRGATTPPWPARDYFISFISERGAGGLYDYWSQISGQRLSLGGSRVLGWYPLTQTVAEINALDRSPAAAVAREAATRAGEDLSGYRYTLAIFAGSNHFGAQDSNVVASIQVTRGQPGWRWCRKCECLSYWDGSRTPGPCADDSRPHDFAGSGYYSVEHDTTIVDGERGWRRCRNCEVLVFSTPTPAPCPAGHTHSFDSVEYLIRRGSHDAATEQNNWKRCNLCQCLAYYDGGRQAGRCRVADRHDHDERNNYSVPNAWSLAVGGMSHESGHALGLDHAFGPDRNGNLGNDDRPGAYGDWTDIMSWANTAQFATAQFTPAGCGLNAPMLHKLGWVNDGEVLTVSRGAGSQTVNLAPLYGATAGVRMIQVIRASDNRIYTAAYRSATGWERGFRTGRLVVHSQRTLYSAGQDCWFHCSNCKGMIYGGTMLCPAGGIHDGSGSGDYSLLHDVGSSAGQSNWRWCSKCEGLAFAGNGTGNCPAGGGHDFSRSSTDYTIPSSGAGQSNWKWCNKCQGMTFGGTAFKGACPVGGWHDHAGSGNYVLGTGTAANRQNKWRWCNKCQGLFYAGRGSCTGGDVHQLSGSDYSLALDLNEASGQPGWKWCSKCGGLAFNDGSRAAGPCPGGGLHAHTEPGRYTLPTNLEARFAQPRWYHCVPREPSEPRCGALHHVAETRSAGRCPARANHYMGREYEIANSTTVIAGDTFHWCSRCESMVLGDNPVGCYDRRNHDTSTSSPYVVRTNPMTLSADSSFWRTCSQCNVLMQIPTPDISQTCSMGGLHVPRGEYFLTIRGSAEKWRWCRRCELLALWDGSGLPGPCPGGGRHDHSASDFYSPPRFTEPVQLVEDNLQAGERYDADIGGTTFEVVSISPTSAMVRVTT